MRYGDQGYAFGAFSIPFEASLPQHSRMAVAVSPGSYRQNEDEPDPSSYTPLAVPAMQMGREWYIVLGGMENYNGNRHASVAGQFSF